MNWVRTACLCLKKGVPRKKDWEIQINCKQTDYWFICQLIINTCGKTSDHVMIKNCFEFTSLLYEGHQNFTHRNIKRYTLREMYRQLKGMEGESKRRTYCIWDHCRACWPHSNPVTPFPPSWFSYFSVTIVEYSNALKNINFHHNTPRCSGPKND